MDTSKILFIVGGAFNGIEKIIKKRLNYKNISSIGINLTNKEEILSKDVEYNDVIESVNHEDFRKFGLIPEFLGRLPVICPLKSLTEDEMCEILIKPKNALIKQYQTLMRQDNIELDFDSKAVRAIAEKALKNKTGARGLRSIMENLLLDVMYDAPSNNKKKEAQTVKITEECITSNAKPKIVLKRKENPLKNEKSKTVPETH